MAALVAERDALIKAAGVAPAGHFYSPIVSIDEAVREQARIVGVVPRELPGIDMNEAGQLELLAHFEALYPTVDFPTTETAGHRYWDDNVPYTCSDAIFLQCMLRHFRPRREIEVGSGYSNCAMLDTGEHHLGRSVEFTFIEPYLALLQSLVCPDDLASVRIVPTRLQGVP